MSPVILTFNPPTSHLLTSLWLQRELCKRAAPLFRALQNCHLNCGVGNGCSACALEGVLVKSAALGPAKTLSNAASSASKPQNVTRHSHLHGGSADSHQHQAFQSHLHLCAAVNKQRTQINAAHVFKKIDIHLEQGITQAEMFWQRLLPKRLTHSGLGANSSDYITSKLL